MKLSERLKTLYGPPVLLGSGLLLIWQLAAELIGMSHILPGPLQILKRSWELREALFLHHMPPTLLTVACGGLLSAAIGLTVALLMHISRYFEAALHKLLVITQTIPVVCISPLFVLWFGYTMGARLIAVVMSTFYAIALNTYDGLKGADPKKRELMETFGAGRLEILLKLEVPSALPRFFTALKMTAPWLVIDAAVAEWLGANQGLGYFSKRMISRMDGAAVFAPLLILSIIALVIMAALQLADRKFAYYRNEL